LKQDGLHFCESFFQQPAIVAIRVENAKEMVEHLATSEAKLSRAFDLNPNSPETALLWVRNRVFRLLEAEGESQGIDTAILRVFFAEGLYIGLVGLALGLTIGISDHDRSRVGVGS